jgi:hypothetical protein
MAKRRDDEDWGDWSEEAVDPAPWPVWWLITFCGCVLGTLYGMGFGNLEAVALCGAAGAVLGIIGGLGLDNERRRKWRRRR